VEGDDAPGGEDPADVLEPGRLHLGGEALGPGEALDAVGQVLVATSSPVSLPIAGTIRSNHTEKNVDSGGFWGVVISSTTTLPPGRTTRVISDSP
jgi:hypothetical protein